jgi:hypothetical protein
VYYRWFEITYPESPNKRKTKHVLQRMATRSFCLQCFRFFVQMGLSLFVVTIFQDASTTAKLRTGTIYTKLESVYSKLKEGVALSAQLILHFAEKIMNFE